MQSFSAFTHANGSEQRFVGDSWEEGGFSVDAVGNPTTDILGNSVSRFSVTEIDVRDADLLGMAYAGDDQIDDAGLFVCYLAGEVGLADSTIQSVCADLGVDCDLRFLEVARGDAPRPCSPRRRNHSD